MLRCNTKGSIKRKAKYHPKKQLIESCDQDSAAVFESKDDVTSYLIGEKLDNLDDGYPPYTEIGSKNIIIELNILTSIWKACLKCKMCYSY